jgi:hypothetical protein
MSCKSCKSCVRVEGYINQRAYRTRLFRHDHRESCGELHTATATVERVNGASIHGHTDLTSLGKYLPVNYAVALLNLHG